jgi:hypothetical protein
MRSFLPEPSRSPAPTSPPKPMNPDAPSGDCASCAIRPSATADQRETSPTGRTPSPPSLWIPRTPQVQMRPSVRECRASRTRCRTAPEAFR